MEWQNIVDKVRRIKEDFDRSYKCINTDRHTKDETITKHTKILFEKLEQIRVVLNVHYYRLTPPHKSAAENFFSDVRNKLVTVLQRRGIEPRLPITLHEKIVYDSNTKDSNSVIKSINKMPQTPVEFLGIASRILPEFDGNPTNLLAFLDAINLVESINDNNNAVAISLVKTKLKGAARNLITGNETTLSEMSAQLKLAVKGESVDVVSAKIQHLKQHGKTANEYSKEVEELAKSLQSAYISDGLSPSLAEKYATNCAVSAMSKNCTHERVGLIMQSGQFGSMNDAVAKFINSCTEVTGKQNTILYYRTKNNNFGYRGTRGNVNTRGNSRNYERGQGRGHGRNFRGGPTYRGNSNFANRRHRNYHVRYAHEEGNEFSPQEATLGEIQN